MIALIGFGVIAACMLVAALFVVRSQNLVHAVLWLGVVLTGTAALYAMLGATFLAAVQVLLYVGGVVTLMIFGVMLTRRHDGLVVHAERLSAGRGIFAAGALFGILAAAVEKSSLPASGGPDLTPAALGSSLLTTHVLAFEVLSFLLLAAIVGAIVIARKRDPGAPAPAAVRPVRSGPLEPATTVATQATQTEETP